MQHNIMLFKKCLKYEIDVDLEQRSFGVFIHSDKLSFNTFKWPPLCSGLRISTVDKLERDFI